MYGISGTWLTVNSPITWVPLLIIINSHHEITFECYNKNYYSFTIGKKIKIKQNEIVKK